MGIIQQPFHPPISRSFVLKSATSKNRFRAENFSSQIGFSSTVSSRNGFPQNALQTGTHSSGAPPLPGRLVSSLWIPPSGRAPEGAAGRVPVGVADRVPVGAVGKGRQWGAALRQWGARGKGAGQARGASGAMQCRPGMWRRGAKSCGCSAPCSSSHLGSSLSNFRCSHVEGGCGVLLVFWLSFWVKASIDACFADYSLVCLQVLLHRCQLNHLMGRKGWSHMEVLSGPPSSVTAVAFRQSKGSSHHPTGSSRTLETVQGCHSHVSGHQTQDDPRCRPREGSIFSCQGRDRGRGGPCRGGLESRIDQSQGSGEATWTWKSTSAASSSPGLRGG